MIFSQYSQYFREVSFTPQGGGVELELADNLTLAWEQRLVEATLAVNTQEAGAGAGLAVLPNAGRSYGDISAGAISSDMLLLLGGYLLMFLYTVLMLGHVSWVELRLGLAVAGMVRSASRGFISNAISYVTRRDTMNESCVQHRDGDQRGRQPQLPPRLLLDPDAPRAAAALPRYRHRRHVCHHAGGGQFREVLLTALVES